LSKIEETIVNGRKNRQQGRIHDIDRKGLLRQYSIMKSRQ
jgi:hypothetical protein